MSKLFLRIWNYSFKFQLIYGIVTILTVLIVGINYHHIKIHSDLMHSEGIKEATNVSLLLATSSQPWVMSNDYIGLEENIKNILVFKNIIFATIIDLDGKILAHTDTKLVGKYIADEARINYLKGSYNHKNDDYLDEKILFENRDYIDIVRMIHDSGEHMGLVHMRFDQSSRKESLKIIIIEGIVATLLFILIAFLFAYFISGALTKRLEQLSIAMRAIRDGNKSIRADETGVKELSLLSYEFNTMLDALNKSENLNLKLTEQYEYAINGTQDGLWDWDLENNEIYFSPRWKEILGYADDELPNVVESWLKNIHPDDFEKTDEAVIFSQEKPGRFYENIHRIRHKNGSWVWILDRGQTIFNEEGKAVRMVGFYADITEKKQMEEKIINEEKRLSDLLNNLNVGVVVHASDTSILYNNPMASKLLGLDVIDIEGALAADEQWIFISENNTPMELEKYPVNIILSTKKSLHNMVVGVVHKNSSGSVINTVWALVDGFPIYNSNNEIIEIIISFSDITERKLAEQELFISNDKFEKAFNKTPALIVLTDLDTGKIFEVNRTFEILMGFKREEVIGKSTKDLDIWIDIHQRDIFTDKLRKDGFLEKLIVSFYTKNEDILTFDLYANMVSIDNKEYILTIANDITKQLKAEKLFQDALEQLKQKKQELETIIQEAPNPIMLHNEDGKVLMLNKVWEKLTGYNYDEINTIEKWTKKAYGKEMPTVKKYIDGVYHINHAVNEGEYSIITNNAEVIIWQFSTAPLGIIDGKRTVITSAMDVTELKRKDELMLVQSRHAAMGEMISMIAHQWRQPISVIALDANNMLVDIKLNDFSAANAEKYAKDILHQTQHLSKTIDDFRNFFKPDKAISKVNMQDVLDETYHIIKDSLSNNTIELKKSYTSVSEVDAYPRELMQVFVNIINNSKDSLLANHRDNPFIEVKVYEDENYVITDICDNGVGIDEKIQAKIFDPYFTTKDEKTGTGLGLYMSKVIIEDHLHGKLETFNMDKGACFRVMLLKKNNIV
jgi:PAS domain S-box-containing protein